MVRNCILGVYDVFLGLVPDAAVLPHVAVGADCEEQWEDVTGAEQNKTGEDEAPQKHKPTPPLKKALRSR